MKTFELQTDAEAMHPITSMVQEAVRESGARNGMCFVFCPHTTAGITINENADPDVVRDVLFGLREAYPDRREFRHMEGNSAAHLKASAVGSSAAVPVQNGKLVLGTWQGIYFCEFDGPRRRKVFVQVVGE